MSQHTGIYMRAALAGCTLILLIAGGCVERTLSVDSNPPGALVYMNEQEVGRTPLQHDFTWYAKYDVTLRKEGYQTFKATADVKPPVWQWIPFDLFAELLPIPFKDRQSFTYDMKPSIENPSVPALLQRSDDMRGDLESSHFLSATQPVK